MRGGDGQFCPLRAPIPGGRPGRWAQETLTASGPIGLVAVVHGAASVYRSSQALSRLLAVIWWLDHLLILSTKEMDSSKVSGLKSHSYCMSKLEFTTGHPRLQILCFFFLFLTSSVKMLRQR